MKLARMKWIMMTSSGSPFFSYIPMKNMGIIRIIIPRAAREIFPVFFRRKKAGTPTTAAMEKQMSCHLVRPKRILDFTFVRSLGTETLFAI